MKLTILGCWAPYPRAGGACSGYLLQSAGKNLLIECGNGVMGNLLKYIDFRDLHGVIISHLHPDHHLDLYCLRHAVEGARRQNPGLKPLPLYMPQEPAETFEKLAGYTQAFEVRAIESLPGSECNGLDVRETLIENFKVKFLKTEHPLVTYCFLVEGEGEKIFYSADTKWADYLPNFASGADLVLCECSVLEEDKAYTSVGHLTCSEAGILARKAGAEQLVATHFWPEYNLETIRCEVESGFGRPVVLAREGLEIPVKKDFSAEKSKLNLFH